MAVHPRQRQDRAGPPLVKANYKDKFGAAVGYLTAELSQPKLK
jgi:hypothetical protein